MEKKNQNQAGNWRVLYVNSRAEKKVAERLTGKGFEVFCPLRTTIRQWSDRKKKVRVPYFPSYVFVRYEEKDRLSVVETPGVVGLVYYLHRPAVIREKEMQEVMQFFEDHSTSRIDCTAFEPGDRLQIDRGVLREKEGIVIRQTKYKVILYIEELGMSVTAEVPKSAVVPAK